MSVIAPAAMCAHKLPPNGILNVNSVVMFPLITLTAVTVPPALPLSCRSLVWTELGSTGTFQFTSSV